MSDKQIFSTNLNNYLDEGMRDLVQESFELLEQEQSRLRQGFGEPRHDYSFIVFPAAKAYEGFLKKVLVDLKLITRAQYTGDRFRIGRALNPNLPVRYRWDWVFAKLTNRCGGSGLVLDLWETWKMARNGIFHFFPGHTRFVTIDEAGALVNKIVEMMERVLVGCRIS